MTLWTTDTRGEITEPCSRYSDLGFWKILENIFNKIKTPTVIKYEKIQENYTYGVFEKYFSENQNLHKYNFY